MKKEFRWRDILAKVDYGTSDSLPINEELHLSVETTNKPILARVYADGHYQGELVNGGISLSFTQKPSEIRIIPTEGSGIMSRAKLEVGTERTTWVPAEEDGGVYIVENYELYEKLIKDSWYTFSGEFPSNITSGDLVIGPNQEAYTIHPTRPKTIKPKEDIERTLTIVLYED